MASSWALARSAFLPAMPFESIHSRCAARISSSAQLLLGTLDDAGELFEFVSCDFFEESAGLSSAVISSEAAARTVAASSAQSSVPLVGDAACGAGLAFSLAGLLAA